MIKNHSENDFPTYFVNNDNSVTENTEEIANEFNNFFVNVGPNLATEISDVDHSYDFAFNSNNSVFLGGVCESDVLEDVRKVQDRPLLGPNLKSFFIVYFMFP